MAARVQAALASENNLKFFILCACSPGQTSLVSEELGQSLFAHYLDQGLRGHAEGYAGGAHDFRITVAELAEFVKEHVDRCAWKTRGVRQTPVMVSHGDDFTLVRFDESSLTGGGENEPAKSYPAWLAAAWDARDKWRADRARLGPGVLRELEAVLLRTERRWRGGIEEKRLPRGVGPRPEALSDASGAHRGRQPAAASRFPGPGPARRPKSGRSFPGGGGVPFIHLV